MDHFITLRAGQQLQHHGQEGKQWYGVRACRWLVLIAGYRPWPSVHWLKHSLPLPYYSGKMSRWLHDSIKVGTSLTVKSLDGDFTLAVRTAPSVNSAPGRVVLVSGGVGVTPVMAMLRGLVQQATQGRRV